MTVEIITGDCRDVLKTLPSESAHCVVTSPPYWGLRDYGVAPSVWGGRPDCDHDWGATIRSANANSVPGPGGLYGKNEGGYRNTSKEAGCFCTKCDAWRGNFGLEPSYLMFVEHTIEIFAEVRRVLRPDGTLWLNLGDSYATGAGRVGGSPGGGEQGRKWYGRPDLGANSAFLDRKVSGIGPMTQPNWMPQQGLKSKDLVGIPWRVALALQADGWYLRQDIIWHKPNPMPESIVDRCTKAHEYIFLLSKSERYFYDADAIKEPASYDPSVSKMPDGWDTGAGGHGSFHREGREKGARSGNKERKPASARGVPIDTGGKSSGAVAGSVPWQGTTRNKRSVWTVGTEPFKEAHFATFPPALIEPCIKAGCPAGGTVLDPFGGAGTTGLVADRLQRNAVLIELNAEYAAMARRRIDGDAPLFTGSAAG